jgi:hypothetical protein
MLNPDPTQRMSIADIFTHPWMCGQAASKERVLNFIQKEFPLIKVINVMPKYKQSDVQCGFMTSLPA